MDLLVDVVMLSTYMALSTFKAPCKHESSLNPTALDMKREVKNDLQQLGHRSS